jgi:hypothetical protein
MYELFKIVDLKLLALHCIVFESRQGRWIHLCEGAFRLAYGTSVVLLMCPFVLWIMHPRSLHRRYMTYAVSLWRLLNQTKTHRSLFSTATCIFLVTHWIRILTRFKKFLTDLLHNATSLLFSKFSANRFGPLLRTSKTFFLNLRTDTMFWSNITYKYIYYVFSKSWNFLLNSFHDICYSLYIFRKFIDILEGFTAYQHNKGHMAPKPDLIW